MSATIEQKIKVLHEVRKLIHGDETSAICFAISNVMHSDSRLEQAGAHIKEYIRAALAPQAFLESWMDKHYPLAHGDSYCYGEHTDAMRRTRLAWLDWMIACYEEDLAKLKGQP